MPVSTLLLGFSSTLVNGLFFALAMALVLLLPPVAVGMYFRNSEERREAPSRLTATRLLFFSVLLAVLCATPLVSSVWPKVFYADDSGQLYEDTLAVLVEAVDRVDVVTGWSPAFGGVCLVAAADSGGAGWDGIQMPESECGIGRFTEAKLTDVRLPDHPPLDPEPGWEQTTLLDVSRFVPFGVAYGVLGSAAVVGFLAGMLLVAVKLSHLNVDPTASAASSSTLDASSEEE